MDDIKREKNIKMEIHVHKLRETAIIFDQFSRIIEHWQNEERERDRAKERVRGEEAEANSRNEHITYVCGSFQFHSYNRNHIRSRYRSHFSTSRVDPHINNHLFCLLPHFQRLLHPSIRFVF